MSTLWHIECAAHKLRISNDGWNHGDQELALLWRHRDELIEITSSEVFVVEEVTLSINYRDVRGFTSFLRAHHDCHVELVNEYGDRVDIDTMAKLPPKHCPTCTCEAR